jgi:serine/threonine-protein kinase
MSPEQVEGNRGIDERTDIFSAGVCLYELLAIREPFRGRNIDETFENIKLRDPEPPSVRSPDREMPAGADEVVMKAIQKRPGARFQTMRDFIAAIEDLG